MQKKRGLKAKLEVFQKNQVGLIVKHDVVFKTGNRPSLSRVDWNANMLTSGQYFQKVPYLKQIRNRA